LVHEMSQDELLALPVSVDLFTAGRAFGLGRTKAHELARAGEFPCRVLRVGVKYRVPRSEILRTLGIEPSAATPQVADRASLFLMPRVVTPTARPPAKRPSAEWRHSRATPPPAARWQATRHHRPTLPNERHGVRRRGLDGLVADWPTVREVPVRGMRLFHMIERRRGHPSRRHGRLGLMVLGSGDPASAYAGDDSSRDHSAFPAAGLVDHSRKPSRGR
jgi:hypothetical protein